MLRNADHQIRILHFSPRKELNYPKLLENDPFSALIFQQIRKSKNIQSTNESGSPDKSRQDFSR